MGICDKLYSDRVKEKLLLIKDRSIVARKLLEFDGYKLNSDFTRNADIDKDGIFTILPKGKECAEAIIEVTTGVEYHPKNRIPIRPGAFIRTWAKEFLINFEDADVESFVNMFTASKKDVAKLGFTIVEGLDIVKYYHHSSHSPSDTLGTLGNSCMRDSAQSPLVKFYAANPHRIKLLILFGSKPNTIIGRAIVWHLYSGKIFMDRIYGSDATQELFIKYASSSGWYYKQKQSRSTENMVGPEGKVHKMDDEYVTDLTIQQENMPYLDTFHSCYPNLRILATHKNLFGGMDYYGIYQNQHGQAKDTTGVFIQSKNLYLNADMQAAYFDHQGYLRGTLLNFLKKETFQDAQMKEFFHLSNVVFGPTGKTYVKDNPNIIALTGEPFVGYVPKSETSVCYANGLIYITKMHGWLIVNITTKSGKKLTFTVMETNLTGLLTKLGVTEFTKKDKTVTITDVDDTLYAPLAKIASDIKKNASQPTEYA